MNLLCGKFLKATRSAILLSSLAYAGLAQAQDDDSTPAPPSPDGKVVPVATYVHPTLATNSTDPVGICWVIAVDNSSSITSPNGEYQAQLDSIAETISRDDFRESLFTPGGPKSAAIAVVDYGSDSKLLLPWIDFRESDREKFRQVANIIQSMPRRQAANATRHDGALKNASISFDESLWSCDDKHVVIMTDGKGKVEENLEAIKLLATRHGAIVSALTTRTQGSIYTATPDNKNFQWYKDNLTTQGNKYTAPDGEPVKGGLTLEVAREVETRGTNTAQYKNRVFKFFRDLVTMHSASLSINKDTRVVKKDSEYTPPKINLG